MRAIKVNTKATPKTFPFAKISSNLTLPGMPDGTTVFLSDDRTPDQTKICADVQSSSSRPACQTCGERMNERYFSFKQTSARNGDDTTALLDLWQRNHSNLHSCLGMQMIHPAPEGWRSRRQEVLSNRSLARRQCVT